MHRGASRSGSGGGGLAPLADLVVVHSNAGEQRAYGRDRADSGQQLGGSLRHAVNGHALGGGFVLMLAGDLRLGADDESIRLGIPEARAGIPFPAGSSEFIRAELPAPLCRRLALSSAILSPSQLHREGVLDALHPRGDLLAQAVTQCVALAAQPAFAAVKQQVRGPLMARLASPRCGIESSPDG